MSKLLKTAVATIAAVPVVAFAPLAHAVGNGQIEQGDIYRVKNVTTNGSFADNITAACGDTVQFRVVIHNGGPETLTNVKVAATLNGASSTSHGSQVSLSADNNLHGATVTDTAGVNTASATTASYVSGSTQLLNASQNVLKNLPDGILSGGVNVGSIGPLTPDTEEVQFQVKVSCPAPKPQTFTATATATASASASAKAKAEVKCTSPTVTPVTPPASPTPAPQTPSEIPNTGAGDVLGIFAGASATGAAAHQAVRRFRRK
jgi:uncharacterized repeat protein (TIGR01451 family)